MDRHGSLWPDTELNSVPWATLRHAYGAAADVPGMITALRDATDAESAGQAEHALWCAILHQGNVYSATAPVLPNLRRPAGRNWYRATWRHIGRVAAYGRGWRCPLPAAGLMIMAGRARRARDTRRRRSCSASRSSASV